MAGEEKAHVEHASALRYVVCWGILLVLSVATYLVATYDLGEWSLFVALLIATTKATVVSLFFMHLWDHRGANRLVFVVSVFFVVILIALVLTDVGTRFPLAVPGDIMRH
jgi:cytochrome c oxidase subunit 4